MTLRLLADDAPTGEPDPERGRARDAALLARIREGDEAAFEQLFREHFHGLAGFASRLVGSDALAEELVQDVLLRLWVQRERFDIRESVVAYLYSAVRNQALTHLRHEKVVHRWRLGSRSKPVPATPALADETTRAAELAKAIERAIAALPPRTREAFLLRRQHHLSYAEIATVMGTALKTVEIHLGVALKSLRKSLAEWLAP
jgi:RNA polymerase sigma-70 factor (ECF subfamily)